MFEFEIDARHTDRILFDMFEFETDTKHTFEIELMPSIHLNSKLMPCILSKSWIEIK